MPDHSENTRDRIRELVRQVLASVPDERPSGVATRAADSQPEHLIVNSLQDRLTKEWDRDESAKTLLTEDDLRGLDHGARLRVATGVRFTSLAADIIRDRGIELITKESRKPATKIRSAAIGADHGGFRMKEAIKTYLTDLGLNVRDFGTDSEDAVDYPDIASAVARAVGAKQVEIGVIIDGAGIGSAMTANKIPGVRAAQCYSVALAKNSREHNGANVLTLGAGQNDLEQTKAIVEAFLTTEISEERHMKRVAKIDNIDREFRR